MTERVFSIIKRFPAFFIALSFFLLLEVFLYLIPVEYGEGAGVFLTNYRRSIAEASTPEFDYIILGDSRSLSLMGHPPSPEENWSVYNFSLPAMGPRYFPYFLEKYLKNRESYPAAVIFAADPELFQKSFDTPLHDPEKLYSPVPEQGMGEYLINRVVNRVQYLFSPPRPAHEGPYSRDLLWNAFSHRYLQLFSPMELMEQYTGPERIFILKESIPLLYRTYRFRKAIKSHTFGLAAQLAKVEPLPPVCSTCEGLLRPECHPDLPRIEDNLQIERGLEERYGQINLADRLSMQERFAYLSVREKMIREKVGYLNKLKPDMKYMHRFVDAVTSRGMKLILTDVPSIDRYRKTKYHIAFYKQLEAIAAGNPNVALLRFPDPYYPSNLFVEQVHYDCPGAKRLNDEFYSAVMPRILAFAPPDQDPTRIRGFSSLPLKSERRVQ